VHDASSESPYMNMEQGIPAAIMKNPNMTNLELEQSLDDDDDDDNMEFAKTILSSVNTVDGIQDICGFIIVCFVSLVGDMSRGVFFPTMWPLVQSLGGTTVTLGYSVASFSFGRILVSPIFGSWSVTYGYKRTLLLSTSILLCGTLLYGQVVNVGRTDYFIFTQTILGFGSGTLGVTRAFVAEVTPTRSRTTYMAMLTTVQYAGFAVTPFIGSVFVHLFNSYDIAFEVG
jgi:MFS family permease